MIANVYIGNIATAGGTANAITASYVPAPTVLADKMILYFRATAANTTTTPTFSPNGLTARTIVKQGGTALAAGDIPAVGAVMEIVYDEANTRWELLNPATGNRTYKVYRALLTQSGVNAPVATVLENTLGGTVVWTRNGDGDYTATATGLLTANKTIVNFGVISYNIPEAIVVFLNSITVNSVGILVRDSANGFAALDGICNSIEIMVYN